MSETTTMRLILDGLPELKFSFCTTSHHRYPDIPVVRMETAGETRLAAYGQYLTNGDKRVHIYYTGAEGHAKEAQVGRTVSDEIFRLLAEWPEDLKQAVVRQQKLNAAYEL